jgi:hypothetical protein
MDFKSDWNLQACKGAPMKKGICLSIMGLILFCSTALAGLVDNHDGTVTDTETGLTWQQAEAGSMTWEEALLYCENLVLADHDDWRLPNTNELLSIVDYDTINPSIDITRFPAAEAAYWSSTTHASIPDMTWIVSFVNGSVFHAYKTGSYPVRAVRGGNPEAEDGEPAN